MSFVGRAVLISGAASGIGRTTALRLAGAGATVGVLDIDEAGIALVVSEIEDLPGSAIGLPADVSDPVAVSEAVASMKRAYGDPTLLVNNAYRCSVEDFLESSGDDWDADLSVVLGGAVNCLRSVLPGMVASGGGAIVNVASVNALSAFGNDAYSAGKAALLSLTRNVAQRQGTNGIRCNAVVPGTVRTPGWDARLARNPDLFDRLAQIYPLRRVGEPEDVVNAIEFLLSERASWITGTSLVVDGGLLAGSAALMEQTDLG